MSVGLEWEEFLVTEPESDERISSKTKALATCAAVREVYPAEQQRFALALLTLCYQEKDDPGKDLTLAVAARVAGIDADTVIERTVDPGLTLLRQSTEAARELGVINVPTIVRDGPPVYIKTTGAANYGDPVARLELLHRMINDDGIWTLSKP